MILTECQALCTKNMILFLFGQPGAGKTTVGKMLADDFGFFHYDADEDITQEIHDQIASGKPLTAEMRARYFKIVTKKTNELVKKHPNIVAEQALVTNEARKQILEELPGVKLVYVTAPMELLKKRIEVREQPHIDKDYLKKALKIFEEPTIPHAKIINDGDEEHIKAQLSDLLKTFKSN